MKSTQDSEQLSAAPAGQFNVPAANGSFPDAAQVFVPLPAGNICHFLVAHTADGFIGGYKLFIRSPKNHVEDLPQASAAGVPSREMCVAILFVIAWKFFEGHKSVRSHLQIWAQKSPLVEAALTEIGFGFDARPAPAAVEPAKPVADSPELPAVAQPVEAPSPATDRHSRFDSIAVADIEVNPENPRKSRTEASLQELTESIRAQGELLQPVAVRDMGTVAAPARRYRLIFGEGRWIAHQRLNWPQIDAKIYTGLTAAAALAKALVENLSREDMNAMDEAEGFAALRTLGWDPKQMAAETGKDERTIHKALGLVKLPDDTRGLVRTGELSARQARALVGWVAAPGNAGDFIPRPEVCSVIARQASKSVSNIPSDRLADGIPIEAVSSLVADKLLVEIPRAYVGDVQLDDVYFRVGAGVYTFDAVAWKLAKKYIDAAAKADAAAAKDKANKKLDSRVSVPLSDLTKGNVHHAELATEDERYADHLPAGAIATGIAKDKREVLLCVQPEALEKLKAREYTELVKDVAVKMPALCLQATAALKKIKKIGAREMAFIVENSISDWAIKAVLDDRAFRQQGVKVPKDLSRDGLAKLDPVHLVRVYLQSALNQSEGASTNHAAEIATLRWILDVPKLGLIQEDEKARGKMLEQIAAELWPKLTPAAVTPAVAAAAPKKPTKNSRTK